MTDLSKAKKGDVVHFRCGEVSVISHCDDWGLIKFLTFVNIDSQAVKKGAFSIYGKYQISCDHPFDIVKVESK